ncbi:MAG: DNA gyrase subunit A [Candidatus Eisenbacteria bacterium]|nr:DNA gyrase subunit A [Candidatus Latescibacterota bacterium]MBD3301145.1 DNA gyrase subunit A [Candidatus Eisenbacteria bacterium]
MEEKGERLVPVAIEDEMRSSYIDYSMSVIVSRALPDARDGLKPVHRRILVAMNDLSLYHDRGYRKSAKITGDVTGNYHPHGTIAVYDTMVRMVQQFSLRYPLVDGQGNFGSIDGDSAAAERYTEARLARVAEEMLRDLEKETVDFRPNYDETREEPIVLPGAFPNLIVNGSSGIAVGMATNVPPHNLRETVDALVHLIDNPDCEVDALCGFIKGPDFPTGGIIQGTAGILSAYRTGLGHIRVRARAEIDEIRSGRDAIIVTEIPYMVNKAGLIEKIAALVKDGHIVGISDIRDESDREGLRVVIELKRDAQPQVVLNLLYKHTAMQTTFGANMLALVDSRPKVLNLKELLQVFVDHRIDVVEKRTRYELDQAEKRAHILEGFRIALDQIDEVIALIRASSDVETARNGLMESFGLSEEQAKAILDMRLQRLTGLERQKIEDEYREVTARIERYRAILADRSLVHQIIKDELAEMAENYGDERRTEIAAGGELTSFEVEDLIPDEDMVITISHHGYIKRVPMTSYRSQHRGGKGLTGASMRENDFIEHLFVASTHSYILLFTNRGRCHWLKVHEIPQAARSARGRSILNLVQIAREDEINAYVPVRRFEEGHYLVLATRNGVIKKTPLPAYGHPRRVGIQAIVLREDDRLIDAALTDGQQEIILATRGGQAVRFQEARVRAMGRVAGGVRGIRLKGADDEVVGMVVVRDPSMTLLTVAERGMGKRSRISDYRLTDRGGQGVRNIAISPRTGAVVGIKTVQDGDELMLISQGGQVIRLRISQVSVQGRATQGVRLIHLGEEDRVVGIATIVVNGGEIKPEATAGGETGPGPAGDAGTDSEAEDGDADGGEADAGGSEEGEPEE